ncbi:MAG: type I restriction-modification system subunit M [Proteobacteria bacterium]|nr:type I restriction-modification system subunit M [Pseudomonadota bacterium]
MTQDDKDKLGKTLWAIAGKLRGFMDADDFRDYMLAFLFLRYLSDSYQESAQTLLGKGYPEKQGASTPLGQFYKANKQPAINAFEEKMHSKMHYILLPDHLWEHITELARTESKYLLETLQDAFKYIEKKSFDNAFDGLFDEIDLGSNKLGKDLSERNATLCKTITAIATGLADFSIQDDVLGDAYEYLIGQFASGAGKKAGEFYTPQEISSILSGIVVLHKDPKKGKRKHLAKVLDFACGSGSLLLNVRKEMDDKIGTIYGQEKNITTYNLARMNMLLHGVKDTEFNIFRGDTLTNEWSEFRDSASDNTPIFDAIVANPPFSYRWEPKEELRLDTRFSAYGLAPRSAADFAFLLHGFHYLAEDGTMAIILPHGVLFRGGAEGKIRKELLEKNNIDAVIGLPSNLFYSTGIPVCILILKKGREDDDILFINASEEFKKGARQNSLTKTHIKRIVETYKKRERVDGFAKLISMAKIEENDHNLNISRYISLAKEEKTVDLAEVHDNLEEINKRIDEATERHNDFLEQLGLSKLP